MGNCIDIVPPFGTFGFSAGEGVATWPSGFGVGWVRDAVHSGCARFLGPRRRLGFRRILPCLKKLVSDPQILQQSQKERTSAFFSSRVFLEPNLGGKERTDALEVL